MRYGDIIPAGCGFSTVLADMDFETFSTAGYVWTGEKYVPPTGATKPGIFAVGAVVYSEHQSTEALMLSYDLKDGLGKRQWLAGMPGPEDLFEHIRAGRLIAAWNCQFEYWIWLNVCHRRLGWPHLPFEQLRDDMAKSRAYAWPGALDNAAKVSGSEYLKMADGKRLITKFSCPRKPTLKNANHRLYPWDDWADYNKYCQYNIRDIEAEADVSARCPDLSQDEQEFELLTRRMGVRGIAMDMETVRSACNILDQAYRRYDAELARITGGSVDAATKTDQLKKWLEVVHGIKTPSLDKQHVVDLLARSDLPASARRALEIRQLTGSAGVKKYYAMLRMASTAGRAHDLIAYHVARTGRDGGQDIQPQNLVKEGPELFECESCGHHYGKHLTACPWCRASSLFAHAVEWSYKAVEDVVTITRMSNLEILERYFGGALLALSGCIRGMFVPAEGYDFIASDYSSIEAVVTAVLAGCQWRIEAFRRKEDIYLVSAGRITGMTLEEYVAYALEHGHKHPDRSKIGKPAELGLGFGGWIAAWRQFDKSDTFTDDEIKNHILAWRAASPEIVEMWGGQVRGKPWAPDYMERYGLEGAALNAVENPGRYFSSHGITYAVKDDILFCRLPSGRLLTYHQPRLSPSRRWDGQLSLSFMGWNSNPKMGPMGWIRIETFGGRLAENVVQATAADILRYAVRNLEAAGYPVVLRVHDELVVEVPEGVGSIEEVERIMGTMPAWAESWPIRAAGGWRAKRYRKD